MFERPDEFLERNRIRKGPLASDPSFGNNGAFKIPGPEGHKLFVIASDQGGWQHCSVSLARKARLPVWSEMCYVKDLFWDAEECVVQYHPPRSEYVTYSDWTLHLWKPIGVEMPRPPHTMVGPRTAEEGLVLLRQSMLLGVRA